MERSCLRQATTAFLNPTGSSKRRSGRKTLATHASYAFLHSTWQVRIHFPTKNTIPRCVCCTSNKSNSYLHSIWAAPSRESEREKHRRHYHSICRPNHHRACAVKQTSPNMVIAFINAGRWCWTWIFMWLCGENKSLGTAGAGDKGCNWCSVRPTHGKFESELSGWEGGALDHCQGLMTHTHTSLAFPCPSSLGWLGELCGSICWGSVVDRANSILIWMLIFFVACLLNVEWLSVFCVDYTVPWIRSRSV